MEQSEIKAIKSNPATLLDFMRANRYPVYHKSNLFFRDFQYGLWRYLKENQNKVPYADMERLTNEVITNWEWRGILKRVNRQSFELNLPEFATVPSEGTEGAPEEPKGKPAPASGPAATQAPAATNVGDDPEKAAKLAELQAKMAAAKAKREGEAGATPQAATPQAAMPQAAAASGSSAAPELQIPPGTDPEKAAKIKELQEKMAAAKAKRESGDA